MRKITVMVLFVSSILTTALLNSCARAPTAEMDAAAAAVTKAESDGDVRTYAPESLNRAIASLARMRAEADARRYDAAKTLAQETIQGAENAILDGKAGRERARNQATSDIGAAKTAAVEAETALAGARRTGGVALDFAALGRDLEAAKRITEGAENDFSGGNFNAASEKARAARSALGDMVNRIAGAVGAVSRKK